MPRLIDADALLDDIQEAEKNGGMGAIVAGTLKRFVKRTPTIDHESIRPHGRWEESESGFLVCSECADVFILEEWLADGKWNYCPNCGAKMDLEEEMTIDQD